MAISYCFPIIAPVKDFAKLPPYTNYRVKQEPGKNWIIRGRHVSRNPLRHTQSLKMGSFQGIIPNSS